MSDTEFNNETDTAPLVPKKTGFVDKAKKYVEGNAKMVLGIIAVLVLIIIVMTVMYLSSTGKLNIPFLKKKVEEESEDESGDSD